jgi:hypothetical protein
MGQVGEDLDVPGLGDPADASWFDGSLADLDAFAAARVLP